MMALWLIGPFTALSACIPPPIDPQHPCQPYTAVPEVFATCISRRVRSEKTTADAAKWCDQLAPADDLVCRAAWVAGAATQAVRFEGTREDLLNFCDGAPDCGFYVLDQRPEGNFLDQAAGCVKWTGKMATDCIGHAGERFFRTQPDDATLKVAAESPYGAVIYEPTLKYLACQNRTVCPDLGPLTEKCNAKLPTARQLPDVRCP